MDFIKDRSGRHLLRVNSLLQVPDYVKQSSVDLDDVAGIPDNLFADSFRRDFPIDSPGHVYLSQAYCLSAGIEDPGVLRNIKAAARLFPELENDLKALDAAFTAQVKSAATADQARFAVYVDFGEGNPEAKTASEKKGGVGGFYPINNFDELIDSSVRLGNDFHNIPMSLFVEGCQTIVKAAASVDLPVSQLPRMVQLYGVERMPDHEFVELQANARSRSTGDDVYQEIAKAAAADDSHNPAQWAELWMDADFQNGVQYGKYTLDPHQIFNSGVKKEAFDQELDKWTLLAGAAVPVEALRAISPATLTRQFPKVAAEKISGILVKSAKMTGAELTVVLEELDRPVQLALLKIVAQ